uniref:Uncharacterized protein n=1 Tax=Podoviridae sp. ctG4L18 TaxID=2825234 RepID=A0A8S5UP11_9CAUD|nr:MAG TPA: hypothetical protein [Podoviridae sp. ctG4L18]
MFLWTLLIKHQPKTIDRLNYQQFRSDYQH